MKFFDLLFYTLMNVLKIAITVILCFLVGQKLDAQEVEIVTDKGPIIGEKIDGISVFKGVPFAAAPVGDLRWKAPMEHDSWQSPLLCTSFSASPIQSTPMPFACWSEEFIAPPEPLSEDCLYLNVWTRSSQKKKPVVLWIYGGGFVSGSTACDIYDGSAYAKDDVVFVSANYRVSIFGFLAHPDLTAESKGQQSGNYALLDQIQALKWIQKNIEKFGGDPNNVTIMGQSAGSFSVHALVASPLAKGLFHKAIGHSGGLLGGNRGISLESAELRGSELTSKLGNLSIQELRKLPAEEIFEKMQKAGGAQFAPVLDGYVLPENLEKHYQSHLQNDVPMLAGWVTGDGGLFGPQKITSAQYIADIQKQKGKMAADYLHEFPGSTDLEAAASLSKATLLNFAVTPAMLWAKYNTAPAYVYEFDHEPVDKPDFPNYGVFHTSDVPFALGNLHTWNRPWREIDYKVENLMSSYWLNFIKTGNPNGGELQKWDSYNASTHSVFYIAENPSNKVDLYQNAVKLLKVK